jgi:hypothetical protein
MSGDTQSSVVCTRIALSIRVVLAYRRRVRTRIALPLIALLAFACASSPREAERSPDGLVRITSGKRGNLFADPSRSIDDYDDVWLAEIGLHYADGQPPLADADAARLRKMIYDIVLENFPVAGQLTARSASPCTLKLGVYLASLDLPRAEVAGARRRGKGAATVVFEFRDSQSNQPLVRYGQRRELDVGTARNAELDFDKLENALRVVLDEAGTRMRDALPASPSGSRIVDCAGRVGEVRAQATAESR